MFKSGINTLPTNDESFVQRSKEEDEDEVTMSDMLHVLEKNGMEESKSFV